MVNAKRPPNDPPGRPVYAERDDDEESVCPISTYEDASNLCGDFSWSVKTYRTSVESSFVSYNAIVALLFEIALLYRLP
jgi:hypothetical protein